MAQGNESQEKVIVWDFRKSLVTFSCHILIAERRKLSDHQALKREGRDDRKAQGLLEQNPGESWAPGLSGRYFLGSE